MVRGCFSHLWFISVRENSRLTKKLCNWHKSSLGGSKWVKVYNKLLLGTLNCTYQNGRK